MREGGKSLLYIPSRLAYGTQGVEYIIPPNSLIIFEVELLEILDGPPNFFLDLNEMGFYSE
jgi:FKBP-type peptidyl-prolyl cis-trans isomerase FkpA